MKSNKLKSLITGSLAAVLLLIGIGATTADAQGRRGWHGPGRVVIVRPYNPYWYGRSYDPFWGPSYYRSVDPIAYQRERGYSEGKGEGKDDAKDGRDADPTATKDYLKSDSQAFRQAFIQGYQDGYQEKMDDIRDGD